MAVNITIRAVPDEVRATLAARASAEGRSLQEYLSRELASIASKPSLNEVLAMARHNAVGLPPTSMGEILEDIHADRR